MWKSTEAGRTYQRGFFTSFDEKAYLNEELMKEVDETLADIIPPEKPRPGRKKTVSEKVISGKVISEKTVSDKVMSDKPEGRKAGADPGKDGIQQGGACGEEDIKV